MRRFQKDSHTGIALFILMTSLLIISLAMHELIQGTNVQVEKVRNSYDRTQAFYLARSATNLARFFLIFDAAMDRRAASGASDTYTDLWAQPVPFPVPMEVIQGYYAQETQQAPAIDQDKMKQCSELFADFIGNATAEISDLSAKINLNELEDKILQQVLIALLSPNFEFLEQLDARNIRPEETVAQIRDYIDPNDTEETTNASELIPYTNEQLNYGPKNLFMTSIDELKLIPGVDDELFHYLDQYTAAIHFAGRRKGAKINLNTVSKEVFQALLKNVSNPEEIAEAFIKDREENLRVYTDKNIVQELANLGLDRENFHMNLVGGQSSYFEIKTTSIVNDVELQLISWLKKPGQKNDPKPFIQVRIKP